jgi:glycosyltransferase involved in cell wall biosynthesis
MLKICIFTETYYPVVGGGETQSKTMAENLAQRGFPVMLLTRRSHASFKRTEQYGEITVHRLPPVGNEHFKKWGLLFTSIPILIRYRRQYDLIFVSGFRVIGLTGVIVARLLGKKCILKADSLGEMSGDFFTAGLINLRLNAVSFLFKVFLRFRNFILKKADAFVAISLEVEQELTRQGVNPAHILAIPNSVDTGKFHPVNSFQKQQLRKKLNLPEQDRIVLYTGRLVSYKGLPLLLQVWHQVQRHKNNLLLVLVGAGGLDIHNCEKDLKNYVNQHDLRDSVQFTGDVRNVHEYLQAADIYVFPTESEAFGIALIEAMACSLPVISTSTGGIKDILRHQYNGLLVPPGEFQQLFDALDTLISDSELANCLGRAAWKTVQERSSTQIVTGSYVKLLQNLT